MSLESARASMERIGQCKEGHDTRHLEDLFDEIELLNGVLDALRNSCDPYNGETLQYCNVCFAPMNAVRPGKAQCNFCEEREYLRAENEKLKKHQSVCECGVESIKHVYHSDWHAIENMTAPCPYADHLRDIAGFLADGHMLQKACHTCDEMHNTTAYTMALLSARSKL